MRQRGVWGAAKRGFGAVCLGLGVALTAATLMGWVQGHGEAVLLLAGLRAAPSPSPASEAAVPEETAAQTPLFPDDGVVPFHGGDLPETAATPEPGRDYGEVEETLITGGETVDNFTVRDTTGSGTDLLWELSQPPAAQIKGDGSVEVLIYHTHTSEAYSESAPGFYYTDMALRTGNQDMNVVAAGEALKNALAARGIGAVHDATVCDTLFNGSYSRSWEVIQKNLAEYPGIRVTIDLHRDSMTTESGLKYKPTAEINGRKAAQIMLLAGCNYDGSWDDFPDWEQNLRLMLRVQQSACRRFPDLMRPMDFSISRYNMNATPGSMLIEVGTEVNTVSEARYAASLFGDALADALLLNSH